MKAAIHGIGVVGGFGCGIPDLAAALKAGRNPAEGFPMATLRGDIRVPMLLADTSPLGAMVDRRALRRTDHYTRMALLGCLLALADGGISDPSSESLGIIVGTGYGSTCNTFDFQELCTEADVRRFSPIQFSNSVHNAAGAHISAFLGSMGPNLSINQFDVSVPMAFLTAMHWLEAARVERVLVGLVDEFSRITAYHRHGRVAGTDAGKDLPLPAAVGEGSAFFLLSRETGVPSRYGRVGSVSTGSGVRPPPEIPREDACFIGADGLSSGESAYGRSVRGPAAAYAHLYGNLPVGMGFDIALAVLSLKAGTLFPSTGGGVPLPEGPAPVQEAGPLPSSRIHCFKIGAAGGYGSVVIEKG